MNDVELKIILSVISLLGVIITSVVVPYIKSKIDSEKLHEYKEWATIAVRCAEMLWKESGHGEDKKEYTMSVLKEIINKNKAVLTDEQLSMIIEAAVKSLHLEEGV